MKLLKSAYNIHLEKTEKLLIKSSHQANPALWLYLNDLRTPLFMLEALSRLTDKIYKKKLFGELKDEFKTIEDALGKVDHYVAIVRLFENDKAIPEGLINYFRQRAYDAADDLNYLLEINDWFDGLAIDYIAKEIDNLKWKDADKETTYITTFYKDEIKEALEFAKETKFHFDNVEEDVHELRRKIRWLSIYPQALLGIFQYKTPVSKKSAHDSKYQTPEVVKSPFNALPTVIKTEVPILLNKNNFLALSWTIAELGNLKDEGLKIEALVEALQNVYFLKTEAAYEKAYQILGKKQVKMQTLLDKAEVICKAFFDEKNLDGLLAK